MRHDPARDPLDLRPRARRLAACGTLLLALLACWGTAGAAEPAVLPREVNALCAYLGTPTHPQRAMRAWDLIRDQEAERAVLLASALGLCGGVGALEPLQELLRDRDRRVRTAAIRSAGRVGLRDAGIVGRLRDVLRWRTGEERIGAILALGHLGDGRDVDRFLELGLEPDDATARAAFRALRVLTGARLPPVYARWSYWWRTTEHRLRTDLVQALTAIENHSDSSLLDLWRDRVLRAAWVDVAGVETRMDLWLRASDQSLRRQAVFLVGELGLCRLGPRIEHLRLFTRSGGPLAHAAEDVLEKMGYLLPPEPRDDEPAAEPEDPAPTGSAAPAGAAAENDGADGDPAAGAPQGEPAARRDPDQPAPPQAPGDGPGDPGAQEAGDVRESPGGPGDAPSGGGGPQAPKTPPPPAR